MRRLLIPLAFVLALVTSTAAQGGIIEDTIGPDEPARQFEHGFVAPRDAQSETLLRRWESPTVGGWGGAYPKVEPYPEAEPCPADHVARRPVVFVHGTSEDAWFWRATPTSDGKTIVNVREEFLKAGWCARELWAISYTGAKGYFTYNDINAPEVATFVDAVRKFTGEGKVDVVAHSLGVTVFRKAAFLEPNLYRHVERFVALAGANHGTTTCRGVGTAGGSEVCKELEPGSAWLAELNGSDETPRGPEVLTIYDPEGDQFYQGPDKDSPRLEGACNHPMPGELHNAVARGGDAVAIYLPFLRDGALPPCT